MRGCTPAGRFRARCRRACPAWLTRSSTMKPWPSGTQPGARWRSGGRSSSLACGPFAPCSSGSTGRTPGRRSRPRSRSSALLRRGNRQPGWRGRLPFWLSVIRRRVSSSRLDGSSDVAQCLACFRLIRPGHAVKRAQQVPRGPSQEALAVRAELISHGPPHVPLYGLQDAPGPALWRAAQRRPGRRRGAAAAGGVRAQRALPERPALLGGQRVCRLLGVHRADELGRAGERRVNADLAACRPSPGFTRPSCACSAMRCPARRGSWCWVGFLAGTDDRRDDRAADGRLQRRQAGLARRLPATSLDPLGPVTWMGHLTGTVPVKL